MPETEVGRSVEDVAREATTFLTDMAAELGGDPAARVAEVRAEIARTGDYRASADELNFGARVAWRNHARCIGRLHWRSLRVFDRRDAATADDVYTACLNHLSFATNGGNIRSAITVFAPRQPNGDQIRIWNPQLIRYAGYEQPDGTTIGDPLHRDLTAAVRRLGWRAPGTRFDVLPLVIQLPHQPPQLFPLPRSSVLEVPLTHPAFPWFADLDLRWHAVPAIANMRMEVGGLHYTACPFNGWYVSFEIAARNLSDQSRYNLLPTIAGHMGLDTRHSSTLWKDRALIELNQAVLHSFRAAGVRLVDHHQAARQFCEHETRESRGRPDHPGGLGLDRPAAVQQHHPDLPPQLPQPGAAPQLLPAAPTLERWTSHTMT